jgi:hypothetical protein
MADQTKTREEQNQDAIASARRWGRQTMMHAMASRSRRTGEKIDDQWVRESGQKAMEYDEDTWRDAMRHHAPKADDFSNAVAAYIDAILDWSAEMMSDLPKP